MTPFVRLKAIVRKIFIIALIILTLWINMVSGEDDFGEIENYFKYNLDDISKIELTLFGIKTITIEQEKLKKKTEFDSMSELQFLEDEKKLFFEKYPSLEDTNFLFDYNKAINSIWSAYDNYWDIMKGMYKYLNTMIGDQPVVKNAGLKFSRRIIYTDGTDELTHFGSEANTSAGDTDEGEDGGLLGGLLGGILDIFMYILRLIPVTIATALGKIVSTIGAVLTGGSISKGLTLSDIFFNQIELVKIDFFSTSTDGTINKLRDNVAVWYVAIRNLSAIALAIILLYVGIRMAISSVAEDKAKYKKMLANWVVSLALLFTLHFIMEGVIAINNALVNIMYNSTKTTLSTGATNFEDTMNLFIGKAYDIKVDTMSGIAYAFIYLMLSIITFIFLLTYIKRMITIAFLIMIAPIITITYSIDKMGDGKSQALNNWMKEFIYNILIQPFHCIIFLSLVNTAFELLNNTNPNNGNLVSGVANDINLGPPVLAIMMVIFMYQAEDIIKNIFNFQASSMPKTIAQGAMFATAISAIGKGKGKASAGGGGSSGKKMPKFANSQGKNGNTPNGSTPNTRTASSNTQQNTNMSNSSQQNSNNQQNRNTNSTAQGTSNTKPIFKDDGGAPVEPQVKPLMDLEIDKEKVAKVAGVAKRAGSFVLRNSVKASGYMVGAALGLATGDVGLGITGAKSIGGSTSSFMNNQNLKGKQRKLAKAYNNFNNLHPELDKKSQIAYSRKLLDQEIEPQNDIEREYVKAMADVNDTYQGAGLSSDDAAEKVEKTIKRIQDGEISEMSAPQRYIRKRKNNRNN